MMSAFIDYTVIVVVWRCTDFFTVVGWLKGWTNGGETTKHLLIFLNNKKKLFLCLQRNSHSTIWWCICIHTLKHIASESNCQISYVGALKLYQKSRVRIVENCMPCSCSMHIPVYLMSGERQRDHRWKSLVSRRGFFFFHSNYTHWIQLETLNGDKIKSSFVSVICCRRGQGIKINIFRLYSTHFRWSEVPSTFERCNFFAVSLSMQM